MLSILQHEATGLASTTDPVSQALVGVILATVFILLTFEAAHRVVIVMTAVALLWGITYFTPYHLLSFEATAGALDINVLVLLAAMMAVVGVLKTTGIFEWAVARLLARARGQPMVVLSLIIWFTAASSALLDNVTTVIFVTPMVVGLARRMRIPAHAVLLPMVMASNIGGTATLIGDPPNIMIGSGANLSFVQFLENVAPPTLIMLFILVAFSAHRFRDDLQVRPTATDTVDGPAVLSDPALARWMMVICGAILLGFLTHHLTGMPAAVPATIGAAAALVVQDRLYIRRFRPSSSERLHGVLQVTEQDIEWPTLAFFGFLFIIVGAAVQTGLIGTMANALESGIEEGAAAMGLGSTGTLLFAALVICWVAALLSALIDNIPFVAVAIPVVAQMVARFPVDAQVLWWALSLGACLGGNGTPIGASANVTTIGLAERDGVRITFGQFTRYGSGVTLFTLLISSAWLAVYVYAGQWTAFWLSIFVALVAAIYRYARRAPVAEAYSGD